MCWLGFHSTVLCRYNVVNFLTTIHKRHPIARTLEQGLFYPASDWYSASVPVIIYVIAYNIWPCYNGTWPYIEYVTQYYLPDIIATSDREEKELFHTWICFDQAQIHHNRLNTNWDNFPDSKVHGATMGPTWGWQDPGGPHVGQVNLAIYVLLWKMNCDQLNSDNFFIISQYLEGIGTVSSLKKMTILSWGWGY